MKKKQTKRIIRIGLLVGTIVSLFFVPWILVKAWIMPLPDTVQEQLDEGVGYGFDGMIVYVDQGGQPPISYAAGWKDTKNQIPADPKAYFKIASISKLYTAVAIAKLAGSGQISLDKTLGDYFPELIGRIENAETITIRLMVQHRSGIPSYTDTPNYWVEPPETLIFPPVFPRMKGMSTATRTICC